MLQSHATVNVPPIAAAHQVSTMQKVVTASGKIRMPCAASSQLWVWASGVVMRFQMPSPALDVR